MNKRRVPKKFLNITKRNTVVKKRSSKGKTYIIMETKEYKRYQKERRKKKAETYTQDQ
jgi:hypothetical protein